MNNPNKLSNKLFNVGGKCYLVGLGSIVGRNGLTIFINYGLYFGFYKNDKTDCNANYNSRLNSSLVTYIDIKDDICNEYVIVWPKCFSLKWLFSLLYHIYDSYSNSNSNSNANNIEFLVNGRLVQDGSDITVHLWQNSFVITVLTDSTLNSNENVTILPICTCTQFISSVKNAVNRITDSQLQSFDNDEKNCNETIYDDEEKSVLIDNEIGKSQSKILIDKIGNKIALFKDIETEYEFEDLYNKKDGIYRSQAAYHTIQMLTKQCGFSIKTPTIYAAKIDVNNKSLFGSLQRYITGCEHCYREAGFGVETKLFEEIAIIDIIIGNFDSSEENLLLKPRNDHFDNKNNNLCNLFDMYSIDHDYTFPHSLECLYESEWFWDNCVFAKKTQFSDIVINSLLKLDITSLLKDLCLHYGISNSSLLIMFVSYHLLVYLTKLNKYTIQEISYLIRNRFCRNKFNTDIKLVSKCIDGIKKLGYFDENMNVSLLENAEIYNKTVTVIESVINVYESSCNKN